MHARMTGQLRHKCCSTQSKRINSRGTGGMMGQAVTAGHVHVLNARGEIPQIKQVPPPSRELDV